MPFFQTVILYGQWCCIYIEMLSTTNYTCGIGNRQVSKCIQKIILSWLCTYPGRFPYPGPDSDNAVWMMGNPNWASISLHLGEVSTSFCQPSSACVYAYKSSLLVWISYIKILSQYHRASTLYKQGWCSHSKLKKMYMYHSPLQVFSHNLCLLYMWVLVAGPTLTLWIFEQILPAESWKGHPYNC